MTTNDELLIPPTAYQVGVAIQALPVEDDGLAGARHAPGYDEATGGGGVGRRWAERRTLVVEKGEEAVRIAAEAIAGQIAIAAQHIAAAVERQAPAPSAPGALALESVDVSFGITLAAGVQALFTVQAESSATVTITLSRPTPGPDTVERRG
jgi:hypothetical protein